jgi:hypothetical protein
MNERIHRHHMIEFTQRGIEHVTRTKADAVHQ